MPPPIHANQVFAIHRKPVRDVRRIGQAQARLVVRLGHLRRLHDLAWTGVLAFERRLARLGAEHRRARDSLGGQQVPLHQHRRHREHVADVVEPVARVVLRKVVGRTEVDAEQIADGVVVFGAVQPPDRHPARIGHGRPVNALEFEVDPARHGGQRVGMRSRIVFRRHLAGADLGERLLPQVRVARDRVHRLKRREVQPAALATVVVARKAGVFEKRLDGRLEPGGIRRVGSRLASRRGAEQGESKNGQIDGEPRQSTLTLPFKGDLGNCAGTRRRAQGS